MSEYSALSRVAAALADGEAIHWDQAEAGGRSDRERAMLRHLREIAWLERQSRPDIALPHTATLDRRTRLWAVLLAAIAAIHVTAALVSGLLLHGSAARFLPAQLAIMTAFSAAALMLAAGGRQDPRARRLGLFYLLVAAALARPALNMAARALPPSVTWLWSHVFTESFLGVAAWQFAREFPLIVRFTRFDRLAERITWFALLASLALCLASALPQSEHGWLSWMRPLGRTHPSARFWDVTYVLMFTALAAAVLRSLTASAEERRRVLWFAVALGAGFAPLLISGLVQSAFPAAFKWLIPTAAEKRFVDMTVLGGLFLTPLVTSYVVLAHRVLTVRVIVRRALRYALARYTVAAFLCIPLVVVGLHAYRAREQRLQDLLLDRDTRSSAAVFAGGLVLLAFRGRLLRIIDRVFVGPSVDHSQQLARAADAMARARTPREIGAEAARAVCRTFGVSTVAVVTRGADGHWHTLHGAAPPMPGDSALIEMLTAEPEPIRVSGTAGLFDLLPPGDQRWIAGGGFETIARIPGAAGTLAGFIAAGPRTNGFAPSGADLSFLSAAASTAGVALEAIRRNNPDDYSAAGADVAFECERCADVSEEPDRCRCGQARQVAVLPLQLNDKFQLQRRLGAGGMGVVYLARDLRLNRAVALKTLPELSEGSIAALNAEARAMASVEHPSLATIFGVEIWRQTPVLVVEYLSGGTLAAKLLAGRLEIGEAIAIAVPLADALGVLHRDGMLHRDIKPSNIGFARNGTPKLLDFGLARLLERSTAHPSPDAALSRLSSEQSSRTTVAGTPLYLSPELLSGAAPAERDDLWAFAVVFVEALAGVNPFIASTVGNVLRRIRDVDMLDLRDWREDMPDAVRDFCRKALHPEAGQRYRSAVEMAAALRTLSGTQ